MAIVQVKDATGSVLDWMVAKAYYPDEEINTKLGFPYLIFGRFNPSVNWAQGGPIIARKQIGIDQFKGQPCRAYIGTPARYEHAMFAQEGHPLVAAMRCYVSSVLGDTVEVPDELI